MTKPRSLLIILSLIALTLCGSVVGTIAWFEANRSASVTSCPISIINIHGALKVEAAPGAGTSIKEGNNMRAYIMHNGDFRDGSVDLDNESVYTSNLNVDGKLDENQKYRKVDLNGTSGILGGYVDGRCHVAQNYTLNFSFGDKDTEPGTYGLFFDGEQYDSEKVTDGSGIISGDCQSASDAHIAKGLRVALVADKSASVEKSPRTLVYGPSAYTTLTRENGVINYVNGLNSTSTYDTTEVSGNLAEKVRIKDYTKVNESKNLLGNFIMAEKDRQADTLSVKVWIWFEGCDTTNINQNVMTDLDFDLNLNFNVIKCTDSTVLKN